MEIGTWDRVSIGYVGIGWYRMVSDGVGSYRSVSIDRSCWRVSHLIWVPKFKIHTHVKKDKEEVRKPSWYTPGNRRVIDDRFCMLVLPRKWHLHHLLKAKHVEMGKHPHIHRIRWWENLQESPSNLMVKTMVSCRFSLKPIQWHMRPCLGCQHGFPYRSWQSWLPRRAPDRRLADLFEVVDLDVFKEIQLFLEDLQTNIYIIYIYNIIYYI